MLNRPVLLALPLIAGMIAGCSGSAQTTDNASKPVVPQNAPTPGPDVYTLEEAYLDWPVAAADKAYASIDGKRLHGYVREATAISRRYRDNGHPQFWGRIEGTSADADTAQWVAERLKAAGAEVRIQEFDLPPQWMPSAWSVTASGGGKSVSLESASPTPGSVGTTGEGLDLEAVYVGLGTAADFAGRNVAGKAVFIVSMPEPGVWANSAAYNGAYQRAENGGAAAVFLTVALPGNVRTIFPIARRAPAPAPPAGAERAAGTPAPSRAATPFPSFTLGNDDGEAVRGLIESAAAGQPVRVKVKLETQNQSGLKTSTVWGTLPGMTDEKIMIVAHRDGYFEAAGDNGSGMATMIGLAEYFAKIPKAKRRRTIEFVGTGGHHGTSMSVPWMAEHKDEALSKVALLMNAEHTALTQQYLFANRMRAANTANALHWNFNGSQKLIDVAIGAFASFGVPTYTGTDGVAMAEISRAAQLVPSFGVINVDTYYHSDHETDATVPWTGLANVTRAFAKIIDEVNRLEIRDIQKAASAATN